MSMSATSRPPRRSPRRVYSASWVDRRTTIPTVASSPSVPARQTSLREHNLALVLGELADKGPTSRARLASSTGLTKATVSRLVDTLIEARLVAELGWRVDPLADPGDGGATAAGRPGHAVGLCPGGPLGIGIEINVDYLVTCAVDLSGAVRHREVLVGDLRDAPVHEVLGRAAEVLRRAVDVAALAGMDVAGVCVAVPGLVEVARDGDPLLRLAPNLGWRDVPVLAELRSHAALSEGGLAALPMALDNEANLAALGELWCGQHRVDGEPLRSFVHLSGEIGVGAGIVVDGRISRGCRGFSGEIGHLAVDRDAPRCVCGAAGCLEAVAGQEAILRAAGLACEPSTSIGQPAGSVARLLARAESGQGRAIEAVTAAGEALGTAVASVMNLVDLDTVILGGLYATLARWLREPVEAEIARRVLAARWAPVRVLVGGLAGEAAVRGAATSVVRGVIADPAGWVGRQGERAAP